MSAFRNMLGPKCTKCQQHMTWVSEQLVDTKPMQIFHCEACDKYTAALPKKNGVKTAVAPALFGGP